MNYNPSTFMKVEQLRHFPFKSFQEFQRAYHHGGAEPVVGGLPALNWAHDPTYVPMTVGLLLKILFYIPTLTVLALIAYAIVNQTWFLLLGLPLFIALFITPRIGIFSILRRAFVALIFVGILWSALESYPELEILSLLLIFAWFGQAAFSKLNNHLIADVLARDEDFLCLLWQSKNLHVRLRNGARYWTDMVNENGRTTYYETDER